LNTSIEGTEANRLVPRLRIRVTIKTMDCAKTVYFKLVFKT